jgi:transcriptional regulator
MYIPAHFRQHDRQAAIAFMRQYPFALLVSNGEAAPIATHLPFHVSENGDEVVLTAHLARANPQWKTLGEALVVFSGPHAYISPAHYEKEENVPTWNYIAVHAYGKVELVQDEAEGYAILEEMMQQSEPEYLAQWERLSTKYREGLFKGIMPFRMLVTRIDGKEKLSQNKTATERDNIIRSLQVSEDGAARETGQFMAYKEAQLDSGT